MLFTTSLHNKTNIININLLGFPQYLPKHYVGTLLPDPDSLRQLLSGGKRHNNQKLYNRYKTPCFLDSQRAIIMNSSKFASAK